MVTEEKDKIWTKDFIFICLANFFIFLGFQMTLPTLPLCALPIYQLIGIIVGIFTFSALLLRPYAGHSLETKGRRFVYMIGLSVFVISVGSFSLISSIALLIFMRVIQGVGWGFSTTASGTIATDIIPPKRRGEGLGYYGLSGNIALALGPSLGLTLVGIVPFNIFFLICAGFGLLALFSSTTIHYKKVDQSAHRTTTVKFDVFEKTAINPSILLFFITVTFGGIATFLPLYAAEKNVLGIEAYFLVYALFLLISRTFAGKLYDQRGHLYVYPPGAILIFIAMLLLAWLPNTIVLILAASLYGLGFGMVQPALQAWAVEQAASNRRGMANATFFSFFDLGVGVGAITFGQLAASFGYQSIYLIAACSVFLSMAFYVYLLVQRNIMVRRAN